MCYQRYCPTQYTNNSNFLTNWLAFKTTILSSSHVLKKLSKHIVIIQLWFSKFPFAEGALESREEISDIVASPTSTTLRGRHLSKSTSELSSPHKEDVPEIRPRSAAQGDTSHVSVYQKAHSFFTLLKVRCWRCHNTVSSLSLRIAVSFHGCLKCRQHFQN